MATIRKTIDVNAALDQVWAKVSDVGNIHQLIGFLSESSAVGNQRVCLTTDGATLKEDIITVDPELRRVAYSITESPLGMDFHLATMELQATDTGTRLTWTMDVQPASAIVHLGPMIDAASQDMVTTLAN